MRCVTCGVELIPGKQFCHACGTKAATHCRACDAVLDPAFRFCPDCGTQVDAGSDVPPPVVDPLAGMLARRRQVSTPTVVSSPSAVEGERKLVTVLFCDLVGSVAIAEKLDPEDYNELLEHWLDVVFPEIYRLEGSVNHVAGDGLMALFGAPVAHEDAPHRAVRAALAIRTAMEPLAQRIRAQHGVTLQLRTGINTGPVVVGLVGPDRQMGYSAIGDTTNLASRLQTLAVPGQILISETTHRLVRGFFDVEPVGPLVVRGKTEPVAAYAVRDWLGGVTAMAIAAARGLTPFVGRDLELDGLDAAWRRLTEGRTQVVAVVGDAGSGKSRLLYEFRQRLLVSDVPVFEGRCSSMSTTLPYHPFLAMFGRWFDLEWDEPEAAACAKLERRFGMPYDQIERRYPLLCRFLSLPIEHLVDQPPDDLKRETFDAVARLVLDAAAERGAVMFIEDLHWIDEPSRELMQDLLRRFAGSPVLLVVTHRPDSQATWQVATSLTQFVLRPLDDDDVAAIVRNVAGGPLPDELVPVLVAKAGGSPFFAEELVRALLDEGHLVADADGAMRLTRALREVAIPGTVQEVIAARLDSLAPAAKRVVQVAAVLGRQFRRSQLEDLLAGEGIDVGRELAEAERRGLLHRKTALGSDELRFGESLTQEVAYETMLLRLRRQLHERVGELLEADPEPGPEHAALLAHHFARSDNHTKAVSALLRAAHDAEDIPSYRVAQNLYRQAWQLAESVLGEREDGHFHRAALEAIEATSRLTIFFGADDLADMERATIRGRELAELLGDNGALANLLFAHGIIMMMRPDSDFAGGLALAERGEVVAESSGFTERAARIARGLCIHYTADGRFAQSLGRVEPLLAEMERTLNRERPADYYLSTRWLRDLTLYANDEFDRVLESAGETFAMAQRVNNRTMRSAVGSLLAPIHFLRGEYAEAQRWADMCLEIAEEIGNANALATGASIGLLSRILLGEHPEPARWVEIMERGLAAAGMMQLNTRFVGEALLAIGDVERAERITSQLAGRVGGRLRQAMVLSIRGDVLVRQSRLDEATHCYDDALALGEHIGSRSTQVAAIIGAAEVSIARGEQPVGIDRAAAHCAALGLEHYRTRLARIVGASGAGEAFGTS
ncbi:MAG TPA: adenylate/guanylate cyclase domain-containing protein [Candidatus Binatia bacterium]|jgi:class 3 adenylate cyclase/tetratricopeptide (TPR) repeat protein|nr:adenylate/guanylate cyclase domain-containing protein [Candidatus Binatia bacterium]